MPIFVKTNVFLCRSVIGGNQDDDIGLMKTLWKYICQCFTIVPVMFTRANLIPDLHIKLPFANLVQLLKTL